jgi:hypothetical protein
MSEPSSLESSEDPLLKLSREQRLHISKEDRHKYWKLRAEERKKCVFEAGEEEFFCEMPECDQCGGLTTSWCEGVPCAKLFTAKWLCTHCEADKGFCRNCSRTRTAAPIDLPPDVLAEVLAISGIATACQKCGKHTRLFQCSVCKKARYCSRSCQKADWKPRHKAECHKEDTDDACDG